MIDLSKIDWNRWKDVQVFAETHTLTVGLGVQLNPGTVAEIGTPIVIDKAGHVRDVRTDKVLGLLVIFG